MANINLKLGNGVEAIRFMPEGSYDIAIVDPPYFSGPERRGHYGSKISSSKVKRPSYPIIKDWQVPKQSYFDDLFRISTHQIIWGCNYYDVVYPSHGRIVWDKVNGNSSFSDCELAFCSFHDSVRMFRYMWNGMMQGKSIAEGHVMRGDKSLNEKRIHSTQKPVNLYKWLLQTYAVPLREELGRPVRILDTHLGSGSIAIACYDLDFDLDAWELEPMVFLRALDRYEGHTSQLTIKF